MMFGLKDQHSQKIRAIFSSYNQIEKVLVYGSRAIGNYRNNSDIDLSLIGNKIDFDILLKIENQLDDLLLPYEIDLSIYHKIENSDLIDHINRVGIIFYEKNPNG